MFGTTTEFASKMLKGTTDETKHSGATRQQRGLVHGIVENDVEGNNNTTRNAGYLSPNPYVYPEKITKWLEGLPLARYVPFLPVGR